MWIIDPHGNRPLQRSGGDQQKGMDEMTVEEMLTEVQEAMINLGYPAFMVNRIRITIIDDDRVEVVCSSSVIGIYDFIKHTFID